MEKSLLLRKAVFYFLLLYLIVPLLHLFIRYPMDQTWHWDPHLKKVLFWALVQAFLSSFFTLFFGALGAFGLIAQSSRLSQTRQAFVLFLALTPCLLPPLFVVLLSYRATQFLPLGLWGIVWFHCLMNVGLSSFLLFKIIEEKIFQFYPLSLVNAVSNSKFILRGLLPELRSYFLSLGSYFMILYFFSFSIPLLVGGSRFGGPEVFIYEKIIFLGQWTEALQNSLLLFLSLFALSHFGSNLFQFSNSSKTKGQRKLLSTLGHPLLIHVGLIPSYILLLGLILVLFTNILEISSILSMSSQFLESIKTTLALGLTTGLLVFILLSLVSFSFLNNQFSKLFLTFINPGWVVVGFSLLLMEGEGFSAKLIKSSVGLSILYIPFLFKLGLQQKLESLIEPVKISNLFSISWFKVYKELIFPESFFIICFLSGLVGLWACGDFALTGLMMNNGAFSTLALDIQNFVNNYRLEQAMGVLPLLIFVGFFVFFVFQGIFHVSRGKFLSSFW